ncbi:MAG TPA: DoxX family protein [Pseudonocardiaceae bacterium]|jgi:putative oxidoreductase
MKPALTIASLTGPVQSIFRIVVGFLFACHGAASLFGVFGGASGTHGGTVAFGTWPDWWAAVIELIGGVLVALGIGTRVAALIGSGAMAFAYFTVHIKHGLLPLENSGEPAALYSWIFVLIAVIGPGPWALAAKLNRVQRSSYQPDAGEATA